MCGPFYEFPLSIKFTFLRESLTSVTNRLADKGKHSFPVTGIYNYPQPKSYNYQYYDEFDTDEKNKSSNDVDDFIKTLKKNLQSLKYLSNS